MSGPIQNVPYGFLSLLDLKSTGRLPPDLLETVQPSFDLALLYLQRKAVDQVALFGSAPATGAITTGLHSFAAFLTPGPVNAAVPNNEFWYVYAMAGTIVTQNAADFISAGCAIEYPPLLAGGPNSTLVSPIYADVVTARARSWCTPPITAPFFAGPGCVFGVYVADVLAGTSLTVTLAMRATRMII
jgi:hypothetical protein